MDKFGDARHVFDALTRFNYLPNQREDEHELPPYISTRTFTPEICQKIHDAQPDTPDRSKIGYDLVEYSLTRFNNVPRILGICHPKPYTKLVLNLVDNWSEIETITKNRNSAIKPDYHTDGRILIMNYESNARRFDKLNHLSFGKKFKVQTDISNCFHSIYTHAIEWATKGIEQSKLDLIAKPKPVHWSRNLDAAARAVKRNETQGIPIGPGTSNIIVEIVLGAIDSQLVENGFSYERYIDDYECYCTSYEEAEDFIRVLRKSLSDFKLNINLNKTKITKLPSPVNDDWVNKLSGLFPSTFVSQNFDQRDLTFQEAMHFFDEALLLNNCTPDGSVLKYAIKKARQKMSSDTMENIIPYILSLSFHFPSLLPLVEDFLDKSENCQIYSENINKIIVENAMQHRSDGMAWPLYYLKKYNLEITEEAHSSVIASHDCVAMLCLYQLDIDKSRIISFANEFSNKSVYEKDRYWILLYQLFLDDQLTGELNNNQLFNLMREHQVNFVPPPDKTKYEKYCDYLSQEGLGAYVFGGVPPLELADWLKLP